MIVEWSTLCGGLPDRGIHQASASRPQIGPSPCSPASEEILKTGLYRGADRALASEGAI